MNIINEREPLSTKDDKKNLAMFQEYTNQMFTFVQKNYTVTSVLWACVTFRLGHEQV